MEHKIFLGGTCAQSTWRNELIPLLRVPFFNPEVENWSPKANDIEEDEKENYCDVHFYLIMKNMLGVYSIAEIMDSVHQPNKQTILQVQPEGFEKNMLKSLEAVVDLVNKRGGHAFISQEIKDAAMLLNRRFGG